MRTMMYSDLLTVSGCSACICLLGFYMGTLHVPRSTTPVMYTVSTQCDDELKTHMKEILNAKTVERLVKVVRMKKTLLGGGGGD